MDPIRTDSYLTGGRIRKPAAFGFDGFPTGIAGGCGFRMTIVEKVPDFCCLTLLVWQCRIVPGIDIDFRPNSPNIDLIVVLRFLLFCLKNENE